MSGNTDRDRADEQASALRGQFLLEEGLVFLNHGSFGACPKPVFEAYQRWQRELERNPVELLARRSAGLLAQVREALGQSVGVPGDSLVLVTNATVAVNTVARSLRLRPGDEILLTDQEYGACEAMWELLCRQAGATVVRSPVELPFRPDRFVERLWGARTERTRLIHLSHVTSCTGIVFPVAEVCRLAREHGVLTLVDGAHGPGQIDLDLGAMGADYYAGNCHKWLCAPKGAAFLYARPEHHRSLDAVVLSWGYDRRAAEHAAYVGEGSFVRRHQWQGTRDLAPFLAIPAALEFLRANDWPRQRARCHELGVATRERVARLFDLEVPCAPADFVQLAAMAVPCSDGAELRRILLDRFRIEIAVTATPATSFVRASFQAYNGQSDADALVAALAALRDDPRGPFRR